MGKTDGCSWLARSGSVRDFPEVGVEECSNCGLVTPTKSLEEKVSYVDGSMHNWLSGYGEASGKPSTDPNRRKIALQLLFQKQEKPTLLDFGCGDGEMLQVLNNTFECFGLEPEKNASHNAQSKGFSVFNSEDELSQSGLRFDCITLFHVIEHLYSPEKTLVYLSTLLKPGGKIIIETPNAQDALLVTYESKEFQNWTYWSHHPMLYSAYALEQLFTRLGYKIESNEGIQRYSTDNHLYWLSKGLPGGHEKWKDDFSDKILAEYSSELVRQKKNDTHWLVATF